ncbi:MAG: Unknown protein [uncultured Sulfurovum sp.]|uniref:Lipoprotein n=1 Tax=uncultured Sulfurovum sp. TaxID=269237 RepID=A0A6S6U3P5_9BACT|nr:MAG: Unknown protein [uncultured Sulfurovum sp.]
MKQFYLAFLLLLTISLMSGCTKLTPKLSYKGVDYRLYYDFEANDAYNISFIDRESTWYRDVGVDNALKLNLKIAAIETQRKGYKYFVLTNAGLNNLEGFPINRYKELMRYITLYKRKKSFSTGGSNQGRGKWKLIDHGHVHIGFKPVEDKFKNSFISVWDAQQTLKDIEL